MRITILGGGSGELPDGVSDWFRSMLEKADVIELLNPLTDQLPLDPEIHFGDGERTYGLVDDSVVLVDYRRTTGRKFLRAYKHDAFRRLNDRFGEILDAAHGTSEESEREVREAVFRHLKRECRAAAESK